MSDSEEREREFAREHAAKSKQTGDHHWRKAQMYTGLGDYIPGYDDGEPPQGAR